MRPGQHNKRGRGRNRRHNGGGGGGGGGSGGGNPLNRVYESNGPDVKVRGTAQTVADKYLQLGRDAQVSGDIVMAESYFQHAEHYLRILVAAQAYQQQNQQQYRRPEDEFGDEDEMEGGAEGDDNQPDVGERPSFSADSGEQPEGFDQGQERRDYQQGNRDYQQGRQPDHQGRDRNDRNRGNFRPRWENRRDQGAEPGRYNNQQNQQPYQPRREEQLQPVEAEQQQRPAQAEAVAVAEPAPAPEASGVSEKWDGPEPSFLKRPAGGTGRGRRPRRETAAAEETAAPAGSGEVPQAD
jgi:hypothetical protein